MPSIFKSAAALAMAGAAFANPLNRRGDDSCMAAVTGKAALGDENLRKEHCTSFFKTIVTPAAITVTTTITDAPKPSDWNQWEKKDVTVCPNEVPNYASACDENGYRSACKAWGVTDEVTFTIPATTTTKTIYFGNGGKGGVCSADKTVTVTAVTATVTVTVPGTTSGYGFCPTTSGTVTTTITTSASSCPATTVTTTSTTISTTTSTTTTSSAATPTTCLTESKAKEITDAFKKLLEYTNQGSAATNNGPYDYATSAKYLASDFQDYSDSINYMSGRPLGSVTFSSRDQFDTEQGSGQQPLVVTDQLTHFGCNHITWKWQAYTPTGGNVMGINHMILTDDLTQIAINHAEFNSAEWVQSLKSLSNYGPAYAAFADINCVVPGSSGSTTTTTSATAAATTSAAQTTTSSTSSSAPAPTG